MQENQGVEDGCLGRGGEENVREKSIYMLSVEWKRRERERMLGCELASKRGECSWRKEDVGFTLLGISLNSKWRAGEGRSCGHCWIE